MDIVDVLIPLDRTTAAEYASWFKALADGTRVQLVSLLARAGRPMSVGEIVAAVPVGQSTVSAHLKVLAEVRFVLVEQRGTARFYRINEECVACFPTAADVVMGRSAPAKPGASAHSEARLSRTQVVERYSGLAQVAASGGEPVDTPTGTHVEGCGSGAYDLSAAELDVPAGALRASMACGNPVAVADLHPGDTVLDLGSGGGLDALLSARRVGPSGSVYGVDASPDMVALARTHAAEAGAGNVEFRVGYLEDIPLPDAAVDVVISNCVFTLSTDKPRALAEAARVLRPGGRFGISDVLAEPDLDPARRAQAEHAVGCPVGTLTADEYRDQLLAAGFATATIIPTHTLAEGLYSAIVQATTPR